MTKVRRDDLVEKLHVRNNIVNEMRAMNLHDGTFIQPILYTMVAL